MIDHAVRHRFVFLILVAFVGLAGGTLSCSKESASPPAATQAPATAPKANEPLMSMERPNIVLVTMEATRPDHFGCYDDSRAHTPALDQLAHDGAMFEQAIATAPLALPSHASMFTGLYPPRHGVRDNTGFTLDAARTTLAAHLKAQGYATGASVGNTLLGGVSGLNQGFDSFAEPNRGSRSASFVVDDAIEAMKRMKGGPFFLWVELDDPHAPYDPPPPYATQYAGRLYDGELAYVDAQVQRLVDELKSEGRLDGTIVVATADEGESLGEHGEDTHGTLVYDTTLKVPLILRYPPKIQAANRIKGLVSLVDLAPTLVELSGLPPMPGVQGKSFAPSLTDAEAAKTVEREPVYAESLHGERAFGWAPLYVLHTGKKKFIDAPTAEIYDVRRDPSETIDGAAADAPSVGAFRTQLRKLQRAIGDSSAAAAPSRRDPNKLVGVANLYMKAEEAIEAGHPEKAGPLLEQALAKDPANPAVKSLAAALRGQPVKPPAATANTFASQWNLGNSLYVSGKLDESAKAFRAALAINPQSAETHYALGNVLAAQGDAKGAETELRAAVAHDPKMADGWNKLGIVLDKSSRRPEAKDAFTRALAASPDHADALFNRAKIELFEKQLPDARRDVDHLMKTHADYAAGLFLDAHLCAAEKNDAGAKAALTKLLGMANLDPRLKAAAEDMQQKIGG